MFPFVTCILVLSDELVGIPKATLPLLTLPVAIPVLPMVRSMATGSGTTTLCLCRANPGLLVMATRRHRLLPPLLPWFGPFPLARWTPRLLRMLVGTRAPNPPLLVDSEIAVFPMVRWKARWTPEPWLLLPLGRGRLQLLALQCLQVEFVFGLFVLLLNTEKTLPRPGPLLLPARKWTCELPSFTFVLLLNTELKTLENVFVLKLFRLELLVKCVLFTLNR